MTQLLAFLNANAALFFLIGALALIALNAWRYWGERDLVPQYQARKQATPPSLNSQPPVTALVPAWNEGAELDRHVESFLALRYPNKSLVLVAGGREGDETLARAQAFAAQHDKIVAIPQQAGRGKQVALRDGLPHITGEIVFLTDADCLYNDQGFERTIAPIINGDAQATTGGSSLRPDQQDNPLVLFQWIRERLYTIKAPDESSGMLGRNCAVATDVLLASGGFDAEAPSGTDYTLARQLIAHGVTIRHIRLSQTPTEYPADLRTYYNKHTRWLRNLIVLGWQKGDRGSLMEGLFSAGIGLTFFALPLVALLVGPIGWAAWGVMLVYGAAARLRYVALNRDVASPMLVIVSVLMVGYDAFVWTAALWQSFNERGRRTWK